MPGCALKCPSSTFSSATVCSHCSRAMNANHIARKERRARHQAAQNESLKATHEPI